MTNLSLNSLLSLKPLTRHLMGISALLRLKNEKDERRTEKGEIDKSSVFKLSTFCYKQ
jgi:hypothetical protein